jgi:hypothetical protein
MSLLLLKKIKNQVKNNLNAIDNFESSIWNDKPENDGLALKIFSETCCNGCSCKSEEDHKPNI